MLYHQTPSYFIAQIWRRQQQDGGNNSSNNNNNNPQQEGKKAVDSCRGEDDRQLVKDRTTGASIPAVSADEVKADSQPEIGEAGPPAFNLWQVTRGLCQTAEAANDLQVAVGSTRDSGHEVDLKTHVEPHTDKGLLGLNNKVEVNAASGQMDINFQPPNSRMKLSDDRSTDLAGNRDRGRSKRSSSLVVNAGAELQQSDSLTYRSCCVSTDWEWKDIHTTRLHSTDLRQMTKNLWQLAHEFLDRSDAEVSKEDLEALYTFADRSGLLERHKQLVIKPQHDNQMDMKIAFYQLIKLLIDWHQGHPTEVDAQDVQAHLEGVQMLTKLEQNLANNNESELKKQDRRYDLDQTPQKQEPMTTDLSSKDQRPYRERLLYNQQKLFNHQQRLIKSPQELPTTQQEDQNHHQHVSEDEPCFLCEEQEVLHSSEHDINDHPTMKTSSASHKSSSNLKAADSIDFPSGNQHGNSEMNKFQMLQKQLDQMARNHSSLQNMLEAFQGSQKRMETTNQKSLEDNFELLKQQVDRLTDSQFLLQQKYDRLKDEKEGTRKNALSEENIWPMQQKIEHISQSQRELEAKYDDLDRKQGHFYHSNERLAVDQNSLKQQVDLLSSIQSMLQHKHASLEEHQQKHPSCQSLLVDQQFQGHQIEKLTTDQAMLQQHLDNLCKSLSNQSFAFNDGAGDQHQKCKAYHDTLSSSQQFLEQKIDSLQDKHSKLLDSFAHMRKDNQDLEHGLRQHLADSLKTLSAQLRQPSQEAAPAGQPESDLLEKFANRQKQVEKSCELWHQKLSNQHLRIREQLKNSEDLTSILSSQFRKMEENQSHLDDQLTNHQNNNLAFQTNQMSITEAAALKIACLEQKVDSLQQSVDSLEKDLKNIQERNTAYGSNSAEETVKNRLGDLEAADAFLQASLRQLTERLSNYQAESQNTGSRLESLLDNLARKVDQHIVAHTINHPQQLAVRDVDIQQLKSPQLVRESIQSRTDQDQMSSKLNISQLSQFKNPEEQLLPPSKTFEQLLPLNSLDQLSSSQDHAQQVWEAQERTTSSPNLDQVSQSKNPDDQLLPPPKTFEQLLTQNSHEQLSSTQDSDQQTSSQDIDWMNMASSQPFGPVQRLSPIREASPIDPLLFLSVLESPVMPPPPEDLLINTEDMPKPAKKKKSPSKSKKNSNIGNLENANDRIVMTQEPSFAVSNPDQSEGTQSQMDDSSMPNINLDLADRLDNIELVQASHSDQLRDLHDEWKSAMGAMSINEPRGVEKDLVGRYLMEAGEMIANITRQINDVWQVGLNKSQSLPQNNHDDLNEIKQELSAKLMELKVQLPDIIHKAIRQLDERMTSFKNATADAADGSGDAGLAEMISLGDNIKASLVKINQLLDPVLNLINRLLGGDLHLLDSKSSEAVTEVIRGQGSEILSAKTDGESSGKIQQIEKKSDETRLISNANIREFEKLADPLEVMEDKAEADQQQHTLSHVNSMFISLKSELGSRLSQLELVVKAMFRAFSMSTLVVRSEGLVREEQPDLLGVYRLVDSCQARPVYKQDAGENYIYFSPSSSSWMVGAVVGHPYGWMRCRVNSPTNEDDINKDNRMDDDFKNTWPPVTNAIWEFRPTMSYRAGADGALWTTEDHTLRIERLKEFEPIGEMMENIFATKLVI